MINIEERKISSIQFSILSPEEIKRLSVVKINSEMTYENNNPKEGGLMDQKLGVTDNDYYCTTDLASYVDCPGYFGYLELTKPVFHEGFIDFILLVLRCVDHITSKLILNENSQRVKNVLKIKNPKQRLLLMAKLCLLSTKIPEKSKSDLENNNFIELTSVQPKYSRDGWCIIAKFSDKISSEPVRVLTAKRVHEIMKNISDKDCRKIGLNPKLARPDWMIISILPIPPPSVRPSVIFDINSKAEDDLTYKLGDIIRTNKLLLQMVVSFAPLQHINEQENLLQYHVASYMNNNVPNLAKSLQQSGRAIKAIKQRLSGKEGRVRGNLMGKRVDFSARTVITPDPNLELDEIGIPWSIALNLTYPETVCVYNKKEMNKLVQNGPRIHPGAKYIIRNDGSRIDLRYASKNKPPKLEYGNQVERHMQDGDLILFNRQPSLHKMSMMGHSVRIMHYSTFRMNLSATSPYNADFDGDEMNLHLPQTIEARSELENLLMVSKCIMSQQGNKPIMGIVQDSLLGANLLSKKTTFLDRKLVFRLLTDASVDQVLFPIPCIIKPKEIWSGKQMLSSVLPRINLKRDSFQKNKETHNNSIFDDEKVIIKSGNLVCGVIDKSAIGASMGSVIHICWKEWGPRSTGVFIFKLQKLVNSWLMNQGFSIGIGDAIPKEGIKQNVTELIENAKNSVRKIQKTCQENQKNLSNSPEYNDFTEKQINKILNSARDTAGSNAQKTLSHLNNLKRTVSSGSKGSFINISQIVACVGQQNIDGKRIPFGFRNRTLPHFKINDENPKTQGFVENSYIVGLDPAEYFFHSMGGREGLIDTAIKTSETGYIQRRLSKALEDVSIEYDLTVRNRQELLVEFFYGEDCLDAIFLENQEILLSKLSDPEIQMAFKIDSRSPCHALEYPKDSSFEIKQFSDTENLFQVQEYEYDRILKDREILKQISHESLTSTIPLPVNFDRLLWNASEKYKQGPYLSLDLIFHGIKTVESYVSKCLESPEKKFNSSRGDLESTLNATLIFRIQLRTFFSPKMVSSKYCLNKNSFLWALSEVCQQYRKSIVNPGEMVGLVAAQSIGQPATQMTLNTFHYAGVSSKNVTLGVPRLKEIINVLKNVKTPSLTVYLSRECAFSSFRVRKIQQALEFVEMKRIVDQFSFFFEPDPFRTIFDKDRSSLKGYFEIPNEELNSSTLGVWLLRYSLNPIKLLENNLSMDLLIEKIVKKTKPLPVQEINSDENQRRNFIRFRVYFPNDLKFSCKNGKKNETIFPIDSEERKYLLRMNFFLNCLNLKDYGIPSVKKVLVRKMKTRFTRFTDYSEQTPSDEYVLDTEGTNLRFVLNYTGVDPVRCLSNDILEVCKIFGIEAARKILIQELRTLISFDGSYVNSRHLFLLVDLMTHRGKIMSITRHGINKTDIGPIAKCSFEETVDIFYQSALFGVCDNLAGISANVMVGQVPKMGTGMMELFLDTGKLN